MLHLFDHTLPKTQDLPVALIWCDLILYQIDADTGVLQDSRYYPCSNFHLHIQECKHKAWGYSTPNYCPRQARATVLSVAEPACLLVAEPACPAQFFSAWVEAIDIAFDRLGQRTFRWLSLPALHSFQCRGRSHSHCPRQARAANFPLAEPIISKS
jgi:hypothetical protein